MKFKQRIVEGLKAQVALGLYYSEKSLSLFSQKHISAGRSAETRSSINILLLKQTSQGVNFPQFIVVVFTSKKRMYILLSISRSFKICGQTTECKIKVCFN